MRATLSWNTGVILLFCKYFKKSYRKLGPGKPGFYNGKNGSLKYSYLLLLTDLKQEMSADGNLEAFIIELNSYSENLFKISIRY